MYSIVEVLCMRTYLSIYLFSGQHNTHTHTTKQTNKNLASLTE